MKSLARLIQSTLLLVSMQSCALFRGYDAESFTVQTIDLFDQGREVTSSIGPVNLKGDWLFRRDRLQLLDRQLTEKKANLIFFQSAMQKLGNWSDFDFEILQAGVLGGYNFTTLKVRDDEATFESERVGWGFDPSFTSVSEPQLYGGEDGGTGVATSVLNFYGVKVLLVNVFTSRATERVSSYREIERVIASQLGEQGVCEERLVVAGRLDDQDRVGRSLQELLDAFDLRDIAIERCPATGPIKEECVSIASDNPLANNDEINIKRRMEKILVPVKARAVNLGRVITQKFDSKSQIIKNAFPLGIYPTVQAGWMGSVRLTRCD